MSKLRQEKEILSISRIAFLLLFAIIAFITAILNANRPITVGKDTEVYINYYNNVQFAHDKLKFEPAFHNLALGLNHVGAPYELFFFLIYIVIFITCCFFYYKLVGGIKVNIPLHLFALTGLFFSSSWFLVATTNGLRQGLAIPLTWLAILYFSKKQYVRFFVFYSLSIGFHYSAILILPGFLLLRFRDGLLYFLIIFLGVGYYVGINEELVRLASLLLAHLFGYDLYSAIKFYGVDSGNWVGFQANLFLYSFFWLVFYYYASYLVTEPKRLRYAWRIYCVLIFCYFVFGFGGYSNRYAMYVWLFLPIMHTIFLVWLRIDPYIKYGLAFMIFGFGISFYVAHLVGMLI